VEEDAEDSGEEVEEVLEEEEEVLAAGVALEAGEVVPAEVFANRVLGAEEGIVVDAVEVVEEVEEVFAEVGVEEEEVHLVLSNDGLRTHTQSLSML